jgi:hypothetical protein
VHYTQPSTTGAWLERVAPVGADVPAVPSGESRRVSDVQMPGITSYDQALRVAKERQAHLYLVDVRMQWPAPQTALGLFIGDVRPVTYGVFSAKPMRITSLQINQLGFWDVQAQEYDPAAYSNTYTTTPTYPDTQMPDPFAAPDAVTNLVLSEITASNSSSAAPLSRIKATWTGTTFKYLVEITDDSDPPLAVYPANECPSNTFISPPLPSPKKYRVNVRQVTAVGTVGPVDSNTIFLTQGLETLATIFANPLPSTGWTLSSEMVQYGPSGLSFSTVSASYPYKNYAKYPTSLGGPLWSPPTPAFAMSPLIDLGRMRTATIVVDNLAAQLLATRANAVLCEADFLDAGGHVIDTTGGHGTDFSHRSLCLQAHINSYDEQGVATVTPYADGVEITARHFQIVLASPGILNWNKFTAEGNPRAYCAWSVFLNGSYVRAFERIDSEELVVTTSASVSVVATLANRYLSIQSITDGVESTTPARPNNHTRVTGEFQPNTVSVDCYDSANARIVRPVNLLVRGVRSSKAKTDWALTANGGTAYVSSALSGFGANFLNDGNLQASNTGGNIWVSSTTSFDQWAQVSFASAKPITEVVGYFLRDDYTSIRETSIYDVATLYNPTSFEWQYYNGTSFVTFAGGSITGFGFAMSRLPVNVTTTDVRILIHAANGGYSRVAAIQALGPT